MKNRYDSLLKRRPQINKKVAARDQIDPRERRVIALRYGLGNGHAMSLRDVGKIMGLSGERVRLIEREALRKLRNSEIINAAGWI